MESRCRTTIRSTDTCNPGVEGKFSRLCLRREAQLWKPSWDQDEDEAEAMEGFGETHAPGGPPLEARQARKAVAERRPMTPPQQKKTRTTEPEAVERGSAPLSQVQLLSVRAVQNPGDTEVVALSQ